MSFLNLLVYLLGSAVRLSKLHKHYYEKKYTHYRSINSGIGKDLAYGCMPKKGKDLVIVCKTEEGNYVRTPRKEKRR